MVSILVISTAHYLRRELSNFPFYQTYIVYQNLYLSYLCAHAKIKKDARHQLPPAGGGGHMELRWAAPNTLGKKKKNFGSI